MRRIAALLLSALAVSVALVGCGNSKGESSASVATTATASTSAGPVHRGGTLTVGAAQGIPQLNPAIYTFAWEETLLPLLWSGLTRNESNGQVGPALATSWSANHANTEWTFKLRPGAKFSNGEPVTAKDVVANFSYYLAPKTAFEEKERIETIKSVSAPREGTVKIKLSSANALLPESITGVNIIDLKDLKTIDEKPIGTGPFMVSSFQPNGTVALKRNADYWGKSAPLEGIQIVNITDPTSAFTSLKSGSLGLLWSVPDSDIEEVKADSELQEITPADPSQFVDWEGDLTSAPFDKLAAREALAYAVNREAILKAAYFGLGVASPTNSPLAPTNPAFDKSLKQYPYNLEKAKQLFAQAGVKAGSTLTWWGVAGQYPEWTTEAEILQASLKKIGINLKIENNPIATWAAKFYPPGKHFPGLIVPNFQSVPSQPAFSMNYLLKGRCNCNWVSPEYQTLYNKAIGTSDEAQRNGLWAKLQSLVNKELPVIIPIQSTLTTAAQANVKGVWVEGGGQLHLEEAWLSE